ncbi:MAG: hypothetical protein U0168_32375 [Nannocystaceae bacterium]
MRWTRRDTAQARRHRGRDRAAVIAARGRGTHRARGATPAAEPTATPPPARPELQLPDGSRAKPCLPQAPADMACIPGGSFIRGADGLRQRAPGRDGGAGCRPTTWICTR